MQLYVPIDEVDEAYHRVLYVFYCGNMKCQKSKKEVRVVRAQCNESQELYNNDTKKLIESSTRTEAAVKVEVKEKAKEELKKEDKKIPQSNVQDKEVKKEKKSKSKKKKKRREQEQGVYGIEVISEKEEVTEHCKKQIEQLLSGKKVLNINEDEEITIDKEEEKHLKELIKNYEEAQGKFSIEDKKAIDVYPLIK